MKILIIDNNIDPESWGSSSLRRYAHQSVPGATVLTRRAPQGDLPESPRPFDRILVSGSRTSALEDAPWIAGLHEFIRQCLRERKPFLGVCYGHQSLVRAIADVKHVRRAARAEFGWSRIELLGESSLTRGLPREFHTYSSHCEEVSALPEGMRNLARSERCEIQACELVGYPVFGVQFHPEKTLEDARASLAKKKRETSPDDLLHADRSDELYEPRVGEILFRNFLES